MIERYGEFDHGNPYIWNKNKCDRCDERWPGELTWGVIHQPGTYCKRCAEYLYLEHQVTELHQRLCEAEARILELEDHVGGRIPRPNAITELVEKWAVEDAQKATEPTLGPPPGLICERCGMYKTQHDSTMCLDCINKTRWTTAGICWVCTWNVIEPPEDICAQCRGSVD